MQTYRASQHFTCGCPRVGVLKTYVNFLRKGLFCSLSLKLSFPMLHKPWWCLHCCVDITSGVRQQSFLSQKEEDWIQDLESIQWHLVVIMLCLDKRCWTNAKLSYCCCKIWLDQIFWQHPCQLETVVAIRKALRS